MVEKETGVNRHELLRWPIAEFYHEVMYEVDSGVVSRRYQEIMMKKK